MSKFNRRDFLKKSSLAAGGSCVWPLTSCAPLERPLPQGSRVAIVGAGLAGLSCANGLFQRGYEVTVYEASGRVGGRVHSLDSPGLEGAELGASFLHGGPENPLRQYCEKHNLNMYSFHHTDIDLMKPGQKPDSLKPLRVHWEEFDMHLDELAFGPFLKTWLRCYLHLPFQTQFLAPIAERLFQTTKRDFFKRKDIQKMLRHLSSQLFARPFETIPLQNYLVEPRVEGVGYGPFAENEALLSKGLEHMARSMSQALNIKYHHAVKTVEQTASGLKLSGDWGESEVDFCVMCLPLGVLKNGQVDFKFQLPRPWTNAMDHLQAGQAEKIIFKFPRGLLKNLSAHSLYFLNQADEIFTQNLHSFKENDVLVGYLTGQKAQDLQLESRKSLEDKYTQFFQVYFPSLQKGELEIHRSNWLGDEFFQGAYSSLGPGSRGLEHSEFRKKLHPHLLFAGEYAHPTDPGTMHGAYWSGLWAAEQISGAKLGAF